MNRPRILLAMLATFLASPAMGQDASPAKPTTVTGTRRAMVVCGLPGDDEHRTMYAGATEKIVQALVEKHGFAAKDVWVRFGLESKAEDGPALKNSRGLSTRDNLAADVAEIRKATSTDDALWVIVLGHSHFDGRHSHWNLPGPDLSDTAFGKLFDGIAAKEQVFFITTSASGFFLKPLSKAGRIAISATEADQEVNETRYPLALADMLTATPPETDRDKDGVVSVLELYLAVVVDVLRRYTEDEFISTEHAQIDDNGDGHGSEVQLTLLPEEDEKEIDKDEENDKDKDKKDKAKAKAKEPVKKEPRVLGPKDDGYLASKVRVDVPPTPKTETKPEGVSP